MKAVVSEKVKMYHKAVSDLYKWLCTYADEIRTDDQSMNEAWDEACKTAGNYKGTRLQDFMAEIMEKAYRQLQREVKP